jgi:TonB-dependent starch-binding outer membrane protein SusC
MIHNMLCFPPDNLTLKPYTFMKKLPKAGILFLPLERFRKKSSLMSKVIAAFLVLIFCVFQVNAQQHQVTGTVTDIDGIALPGVNVLVEGTMIGTITDPDGNYTLNAPSPTSVLSVSFVGYTRERIPIEGRSVIDVSLIPEFRAIDEIVVVGYGTRLREELTGSVSTVSAEKMTISTSPSALGRLQGQVSGVTVTTANRPGGQANIRVRGLGTINNNEPLYVIDGVPAGPGNNLSPNDIESISVLKDASSAAIYGTRGANGVVLITTKRGREGQRPSVNFTARRGVSQAVNQYDLLNTAEYGELLWLEARNQGNTPGVDWTHPQYGSGTSPVVPKYILPAGASSVDLNSYRYPELPIFEANQVGTNWYDEIYRNGIVQEYDLSVTGGGDNVTYAFSGSYLDEEGYLNHTGFERFTFRNNADARFNSWFKAGQSLQVAYIKEHGNLSDNGEGTVISQAYRSQPIIPVYDIRGNFAGSRAPGMGNSGNPVAMLERAQNNGGNYFRILGNVTGEANIIEGLSFRTLLGYNYGQWNGRNLILANHEHSEPNRVDGVDQSTNYSFQWNWSNILNYTTTFADVHRLNVIAGTEAIDNDYNEMTAGRRQYFSTEPDYMQLNSGEANRDNSGYRSQWSLFSVFGRVNYDVMGRYFLEATVRRDGSSRFGRENRYATFPAASVAWALSQEDFMAGTRGWLDFMKLRLGWGRTGNDRIDNYNIFNLYAAHGYHASYAIGGNNTGTPASGFRPSYIGNPGVTWESTETFNLGLDGSLLGHRVNFAFDVWQRNTDDLLFGVPVPNVLGIAGRASQNIASMKNTGFDIELGYNNTAGQFRYAVTGTISRYVNEVTKLTGDDSDYYITGGLRQMNYSRFSVGSAFPEFWGYEVEGIFQTQAEADAHPAFGDYNAPGRFKYRDLNGDGVITPDDMTFIGNPHPDFTGGLNIDLGYGNFDMNMFFYGSYGNDMINYVRRWIDFGMFNGGKSKDALYKSWGSPHLASNADATLPIHDQASGSQQPSSHFVEDGSFFRMKSLRIGYTVPGNVLNRVQIQNIRVYGQVTNLFTITNYSGLDPELNMHSGSGIGNQGQLGIDQGAWPTPRQFMIGVTLGL